MLLGIVIGVVMIAFGAIALLGGRAELSRIRSIRRVGCGEAGPSRTVVKLVGRAQATQLVVPPISQKPCVMYRLVIDYNDRVMVGRDRSLHEASTMLYAPDAAIEDGTGQILLDPNGARLSFARVARGGDAAARRMAEDLLPSRSDYALRSFREERLDVGDEVLAVGLVERTPAGTMLTGGHKVEVWGGGEKRLRNVNAGADGLAILLMIGGVAVAAAAGFGLFSEEDGDEFDPSRPVPLQQRR